MDIKRLTASFAPDEEKGENLDTPYADVRVSRRELAALRLGLRSTLASHEMQRDQLMQSDLVNDRAGVNGFEIAIKHFKAMLADLSKIV